MGWLNKVFGARKDDERPPPSPPSGSSSSRPKPKPASGTSTPAGAGSHSRSASRATGNQPANAAPMSEFMASAMAAAESGMTWENQSGSRTPRRERVIDETTALSSLTDQEIARLTEGMQEDVLKQPLLTGPVPLLAIRQEYLHGSPAVLRKLEDLEANGWDQAWRARGDGDCFYRSFTLAYLLRILYAPSPKADAEAALAVINTTLPSMQSAGFQGDLVEEFMDPLIGAVSSFVSPSPGNEPTEYSLLQLLQDPEKSNYIVVALRLITGAYIRTHEERFAGFLFSPVTFEPISPEQFAREEVEPCGKEADNVQITALASALRMPVRVAYLDQSQGDDVWLEVGDNAASEDARPLTLLYRPGHFDVVAKDNMHAALAKQEREGAVAAAAAPQPKSPVKSKSPPTSPAKKVRPPQEGLHIVATTEPPSAAPAAPAAGPSAASGSAAVGAARLAAPEPPSPQSSAQVEPPSPRSTLSPQSSRSPSQSPPQPPVAQTSESDKGKATTATEVPTKDDDDDGRKVTETV